MHQQHLTNITNHACCHCLLSLSTLGGDDREKKVTVNHSVPGSPPRRAQSSTEDSPLSPLFEGTEAWIDPFATIQFDPLSRPALSSPSPPPSIAFEKVEMVVGGMTCTVCSNAITSALHHLHGVKSAQVNLATNLATIEYHPRQTSQPSIQEAIENIGYEVLEVISEDANQLQEISERQREEVSR
jgi:copper chaperone CopZ